MLRVLVYFSGRRKTFTSEVKIFIERADIHNPAVIDERRCSETKPQIRSHLPVLEIMSRFIATLSEVRNLIVLISLLFEELSSSVIHSSIDFIWNFDKLALLKFLKECCTFFKLQAIEGYVFRL